MPDEYNRTTEAEFSDVILRILAKMASGKAKYSSLMVMIPSRIKLTTEDCERSEERPNEAMWEQRVRNITSHKTIAGNYIAEGYFTPIPGGLAITEAGRIKAGS